MGTSITRSRQGNDEEAAEKRERETLASLLGEESVKEVLIAKGR